MLPLTKEAITARFMKAKPVDKPPADDLSEAELKANLKPIASEVLVAIEKKDAADLASALHAIFEMCDSCGDEEETEE